MRATDSLPASDAPEIPDKLYFRIGEVSRLSGVKPHVLRYWEAEFSAISPKKSGSGHRLYRRKDVELILEVKHLLYEERFTIEGARKFLGQRSKKKAPVKVVKPAGQPALFPPSDDLVSHIRTELIEILKFMK